MTTANHKTLTDDKYEESSDIDPSPGVSDKLSDLFGSSSIAILGQTLTDFGQVFSVTATFWQTLRDKHFKEINTPQTNIGLATIMVSPQDAPFNIMFFIDHKSFEQRPSTQTLLVTLECNEDFVSFAVLSRQTEQPDIGASDCKTLAEISRHIKKSHKFRHLLNFRDQQQNAAKLRASSSPVAHGLIILDMKGRILNADAGAEAILEEQHELRLSNGRLTLEASTSSLDNKELQAFIETPARQVEPAILTMRDGTVIILAHLPAAASDMRLEETTHRYITLKRIRTDTKPESAIFSKAYHLTRAEARVADALTCSDNASDAARSIGISRDTMKSHLSKIYGKAGVNSLPQLMLLIGKLN
ncbi:MAG: hypothetical protein KTR19_09090 [Hyphomicrobiales bacterium]|nr:hypothetical protein [Hyphomicrobiales bacterium]